MLTAELACRGWKVTLTGTDEVAPFVNHLLQTRVPRVVAACGANVSMSQIQFINVGPCFADYVREMAIITDDLDMHGVAHAFNGPWLCVLCLCWLCCIFACSIALLCLFSLVLFLDSAVQVF